MYHQLIWKKKKKQYLINKQNVTTRACGIFSAGYHDTHLDNAKDSEQNELFYIQQYFYFKNTSYRGRGLDCNLKDFNFFDAYFRSDGTLLHIMTQYNT